MKAVVLCAGRARRLLPLTEKTPKQLLTLNGKTIIEHVLDRVVRCGVTDIVLVVGFEEAQIRKKIGLLYAAGPNGSYGKAKVTYICNKEYETTNTLYSVWLAEKNVAGEEFLIVNGDTLVNYRMLKKMIDSHHRTNALVDEGKRYSPESNGFEMRDGFISRISKELPKQSSHGVAIGIYMLSSVCAGLYFKELERLLRDKAYGKGFIKTQYYQFGFNTIAAQLKMRPVGIEGTSWIEIDEPDEYELARKLIRTIEKEEAIRR